MAAWPAECAAEYGARSAASSDPGSELSIPFASLDAELERVEADALRGLHLLAGGRRSPKQKLGRRRGPPQLELGTWSTSSGRRGDFAAVVQLAASH